MDGEGGGLSDGTSAVTQVQTKGCANSLVHKPSDGSASLLTEVEDWRSSWLATGENAQEVGGSSARPGNQEGLADDGGEGGIDG